MVTRPDSGGPLQSNVFDFRSGGKGLKDSLIRELWGCTEGAQYAEADTFLQHYHSLLLALAPDGGRTLTHEDIVGLVSFIKSKRDIQLQTLREELERNDDIPLSMISRSSRRAIEFAVRLWLMIDPSCWSDDMTLTDFVRNHLPKVYAQRGTVVLPSRFNTLQLHQAAGFTIRWTDSLSEHLLLDEESRLLLIFRQAAFLRRYVNTDSR
jgi:hypothetical protein